MAGFYDEPPYYNIPYTSTSTSTSHSSVDPQDGIDPRSLQRCPHYNDQAADAHLANANSPVQHSVMGNRKFIQNILSLTFTVGDGQEFGDRNVQVQERNGALKLVKMLAPVVEYNRSHMPELDMVDVGLHSANQVWDAHDQEFVAPDTVLDDICNSTEAPSTSALGEPNLNYISEPFTQTVDTAATPRFIPDLEEISFAGLEQILTCHHCGSTRCKTLGSLQRHIQRQHGDNVSRYSCTYEACEYSSHKRTDLARHVNSIHKQLSRFNCSRCGKAFPRKDNRDRHARKCTASPVHQSPSVHS